MVSIFQPSATSSQRRLPSRDITNSGPLASVNTGCASGSPFDKKSRLQAKISAPTKSPMFSCFERFHTPKLPDVVAVINSPCWRPENKDQVLRDLTRIIKKNPHDPAAYLWRGIATRMSGEDARSDLNFVLARDPKDRMALLNLAALPLTCINVRIEPRAEEKALCVVEDFLVHHPDDYFAELIKIALNYQMCNLWEKAYESLAVLYDKYPKRASTTAFMSAVLHSGILYKSASDFARETLEIEPCHPLAQNIILENDNLDDNRNLIALFKMTYNFFPKSFGFRGHDLVFRASYRQQDLDFDKHS